MASTKTTTRAQLFARIAETMADDTEVVTMCEKYIAQLSKPRPRKTNQEFELFCENVLAVMQNEDAELTSSEWTNVFNEANDTDIHVQKMTAALKALVNTSLVTAIRSDVSSAPTTYAAVENL